MRITGGTHRGRILSPPTGRDIRPTSDRARLAMFNMLDSRSLLRDAQVMDICCGTGALGLEALSRGAAQTVFVDQNAESLALTQQNATALHLTSMSTFLSHNATQLPPRRDATPPRDLVFLDPPYHQDLVPAILNSLLTGDWLAPNAHLVVETEKEWTPVWPAPLEPVTQKIYGVAAVYLLGIRHD